MSGLNIEMQRKRQLRSRLKFNRIILMNLILAFHPLIGKQFRQKDHRDVLFLCLL